MEIRLKRFLSLAMAIIMVVSMMPANIVFATENTACEHAATTETPVAATCTENGSVTKTCDACGAVISQTVIGAGHKYEGTVTKAPTCTEAGEKTFTCAVCSDSYTESVGALGHSTEETVTKAPTCTEVGEKKVTCSACDYEETVSIDALGHSTEETVTKTPTCTEAGEKTVACSACDYEETVSIDALGHSTEETVTKAPTCTEAGEKKVTCSACDYEETVSIDALGHKYNEGEVTTEATCTVDGVKTFTCTVCDDSYTEAITAAGHTFDEEGNCACGEKQVEAVLDEDELPKDISVAQVGDKMYKTLGEAIDALQSGETLTILQGFTAGANEFIELNRKTNVIVEAAAGVEINGNISIGYHASHTDNNVDRSASTLTVKNLAVNGTLTVCSNDAALDVSGNEAAQLTVKTYREGMNIAVNGNTLNGSIGAAANSYGMFIVPNATGYNLTVSSNHFANVKKHACVVQGCGDGSAVTAANSITVSGNTFASWGLDGSDNRAAFKIWADTKFAPAAINSPAEATDAMKALAQAIGASNIFSSTADNVVQIDAYDAAGNADAFVSTEPAPTEVKVATLAELQAALEDTSNNLPIVVTETIEIPAAGEPVTIDLNGKTVTSAYQTDSTTKHIYVIENRGTLTITGTGVINTRGIFNYGAMTLTSGTINAIDGNGGYGVRNYAGTFTMNGGTIATTLEDDHKVNNGGYDACPVRVDEGATFVMEGGTINNICDFTCCVDNYGTTTIMGGKLTSVHTTVANSGTMTISGGEFTCNGLEGVTAHALWAAAGTTTITGGTFNGKDNYNGFNVDASEGAVVNIEGGNFLSVHSGSLYGEGTITVSGGTFFDKVPEKYCAEGFEPKDNGNGTYGVVKVVKPPVVIPEGIVGTIVGSNATEEEKQVVTNIVEAIENNTALSDESYNPVENRDDVKELVVTLSDMDLTDNVPTKITFSVVPKGADGNKVSVPPAGDIIFRLPVPDSWDWVKVTHGSDVTKSQTKTANGGKYVEVESGSFSEFAVEPVAAPAYVAQIGEQKFETLDAALNAAKTMTDDVTIEIYDKVTLKQPLNGSYSSIKFVGKEEDAEVYLDVQGYTTATGKKVFFEDLKLSKSEGGHVANAGFMNVAFGVYDVAEVTYTKCTFVNGAYASSGKVTYTGCTFYRSHDKYGLWAYGNVETVVDDCTFADYRGIKLFSEGNLKVGALTVKNTDFSAVDNKPAIVLTDGKSVTLENNTYNEAQGVFELDLDGKPNGTPVTSDVAPTCVNDKGACGVLVDGKIYTTVAQAAEAAEAAEENSKVTVLYSTEETAEFPVGTTLTVADGKTAPNVTVAQPVPAVVLNAQTNAGTIKFEPVTGDTIAYVLGRLEVSSNLFPLAGGIKIVEIDVNSDVVETETATIKYNTVIKGDGSVSGTIVVAEGAVLTVNDSVGIDNLNIVDAQGNAIEGENGVYKPATYVAQIGEQKFESLAAAVAYAEEQHLTEVVITLIGETNANTTDSFDLVYKTQFDRVTIKQADPTKVYYLHDLYTGSRTNGGKFIFDGVNIVVKDQYMFEGNVVLTNNSVVKSVAEANCFIYYSTTTVEPGSKLFGVIDDYRGGDVIVDGGRTDGQFNAEADMQNAMLTINWSGDSLTIKNGAYVKVNSANEIGRLTVNAGASLNISDSKLDAVEYIDVKGTMNTDADSVITTNKITGEGKIVIDATGMVAGDEVKITADLSAFKGTLEVINNDKLEAKIVDGKIVLSEKPVAKIGETGYATLAAAIAAANAGDEIDLLADVSMSTILTINKPITLDGNGHKLNTTASRAINVDTKNGTVTTEIKNLEIVGGKGCQRGVNIIDSAYANTPADVTLTNVKMTGISVYGVQLATSVGSGNKITITNSEIHSWIALNINGDRQAVTVNNSKLYGTAYSAEDKGNTITVTATNTTVTMNGGVLSAATREGLTGHNCGHVAESTSDIVLSNVETSVAKEGDSVITYAVAKIAGKDGTFLSLADAIAKAQPDETVVLLRDVTLTELVKIDKAITLDLGGKKVTSTAQKAIEVYADATIKNGIIEAAQRCVDTRKAVELTLTDVTLIADEYIAAYGNPQPLTIGGSENGTKVNMNEVTINAGTTGYGIITFVDTELTATDSTISGYSALYVKPGSEGSEFNFVNSTLSGSTGNNDVEGNSFSTIAVRADDVTVNVDANSTVNATGNYCWAISMESKFANESGITGSTVNVAGTINGQILTSVDTSKNTISVKAEYADELATAGYACSAVAADGMITVLGKAVAKVGETGYATLADAIAAAVAGDTVTLLHDVNLTELVKIEKAITLDLGGKKITSTAQKAIEVYANATIQNGTIEAAQRCVDTRKAVELTLTDVTLIADEYIAAYGNPQPLTIGGSENGTKVNMNEVTINAGTTGYGIITFVDTELTATDSTISGYNALYVKPGSEGSEFKFVNSDLTGSTTNNDVEGNSFSTIAVRADDVTVNVDANSTVNATGNYCWAISMESKFANESGITGSTVNVAGTINGQILTSVDTSKNTISVKAEYADELATAGYACSAAAANGMITVLGKAVAKVGETLYTTLQAAIDTAAEEATIELLADIDGNVTVGKKLTINLNGYTAVVAALTGYTVVEVKDDNDVLTAYKVVPADEAEPEGDAVAFIDLNGNKQADDGELFTTLEAALAAATAGQTVVLNADATMMNIFLAEGITLDLNGKSLNASFLVGVNGSNVVDNSADNSGVLVIGKNTLILSPSNAQLPAYNVAVGGYQFFEIDIVTNLQQNAETDSALFRFYIKKNKDWMKLMQLFADAGAVDHNLAVQVRLTYTTAKGITASTDYSFDDEIHVKEAAAGHLGGGYGLYSVTLNNVSARENLQFAAVLKSGTGAELAK